jgi:thioredoxin 1
MTTKKIVLLVAGIVAGLALLVALFVGAIFGFVFYTIGHSQAAQTAKTFLRDNERLKQDVGAVRDFGWLTTGNVDTSGSSGDAELHMKVVGERRSVDATVQLTLGNAQEWRVIDAYYDGAGGDRVYLTKNFEEGETAAEDSPAEVEKSQEEPGDTEGFDEESFEANVLRAEGPVLVTLGSPSSLDSLELDKTLQELAGRYEGRVGLVQYDLSEEPAALQRLGVEKVPTVIMYKAGAERERRAGKLTKEELSRLLDKYVE